MKKCVKICCAAVAFTGIVSGAFADQSQHKSFRKKMSGVEFGVGVPLVTPLTGYNVFVGYTNKKARSFWGKRFGIRADFTIPSALKLTGTMSDRTDGKTGYDIDARGKIMGFDAKLSDFSSKEIHIKEIKDDRDQQIYIGQDAADLSLKVDNKNMGLLIDFYPFGNTWFLGGIRLTGGYYLGDLDISATAKINNDINYSYNIGHSNNVLHAQITKDSHVGADFHWKYHGPYAGVGFDLGIWRGFKFFMDAGVVFADAPKVTEKNIHDRDLHIKGRYELYDSNGNLYSSGEEMVDILPNGVATAPDVEQIVQDAVGMVVRDTLVAKAEEYSGVISAIPGFENINYTDLGSDIVNFLNDEGTAPWIDTLLDTAGDYADTELNDAITDIKQEWKTNVAEATDGIQQDVNRAWQDYDDAKHDAIDDINDFLHDYGMVPIVKIGFMYRF